MSYEENQSASAEATAETAEKQTSPLEIAIINLKSRDSKIRNEAIRTLGRMKEEQAKVALIDIVKSSKNSRLRISALDALNRNSKDSGIMKLLQDIAGNDTEPKDVKRSAITHLSRYRDSKVIPTFVKAMEDDYKFIRFWAVRGLIKIDDPKATAALIMGLGDPDNEIREEVRTHLDLVGREAVPALIKAYKTAGDNRFLKQGVVGIIGRIDHPDCVPLLISALGDEERRIVLIALRGLTRQKDPSAVGPMIALYKHSPDHRRLIKDGLYRIGLDQPDVLMVLLVAALTDEKDEIYQLALETIRKLPDAYGHLGELKSGEAIDDATKARISSLMGDL